MTIHLQIGDLSKNSEWTRGHSDGKRTALISCPSCGKGVSLTKHNISEDGFVQPSLICPWNCGFHGFLVLDGWNAKDPKVKKKDIFTADTEILILLSVLMRLLAIEYSDDLDKTIMEMESAINIKEPENLFHDQGDLTC